jgi:hypothetical protein
MIVGFGFTKLSAEKNANSKGKIEINNNVTIKSVEEADVPLGRDKQAALKIVFNFISKYSPDMGSINFEGEIIYMADGKKGKEIVASWKKDKKLPKDLMAPILNTVLTRCNIKALILSQEVNLPPPIPLPKVSLEPKTK